MITEMLKKDVDTWLENYFRDRKQYNKTIYEAMNYSLSVGGKRIRPLLLMLTYKGYTGKTQDVIEVAGAVEMIHTYSLIHDDLPCMDDDDLRRGKPTCHKVFGEAIAVLAGDGLLNEAANILIKYSIKHGKNALQAASLILEASGSEGMIGGQVVDILSEDKKIEIDELNYMHSKKTGALIKASILAGAVVAGAAEADLEILASYGEKLGLAFQVKDDILDIIGDTSVLGKKVKSDLVNKKTTYITEFGLEECKKICEALTTECIELLKKLNFDTNDLQQLTYFLLMREY